MYQFTWIIADQIYSQWWHTILMNRFDQIMALRTINTTFSLVFFIYIYRRTYQCKAVTANKVDLLYLWSCFENKKQYHEDENG